MIKNPALLFLLAPLASGAISPNVVAPGNRVVFLGDSIENRGGFDNVWVPAAWPVHFLVRNNALVYMLHNAGVSGNRSDQMVARFSTDVAAYHPDKVFLKAGTNDVGQGIPVATALANIRQLVALIQAIPATPILCTIPPRSDGFHDQIDAVNAGIRGIAHAAQLPMVDFYSALADPSSGNYLPGMNADLIHPSDQGARLMADTAIAATAGLWQKWSPPLPLVNADPNNLLHNGLFQTDANADGIADQWTTFGDSTGKFSLVSGDTSIRGNWQQFAKNDVGKSKVFSQQISGIAAGDLIAFTGRIKTSGVDAGGMTWKLYLDFGTGPASPGLNPFATWDADTNGTFYMEGVAPVGVKAPTVVMMPQGNVGTLSIAQLGVYNLGVSIGVQTAGAFGASSSIAPGSWIEIYGSNLSSTSRSWTGADFNGVNAPTSLDGIKVTIGDQAAFIDYISAGQVNAQVPSGVGTGLQIMTVSTVNGISAPYTVTVNATQPGLDAPPNLNIGGKQYVAALFPDGVTYVLPPGASSGAHARQAKPGETIVLFGIGFGPVNPNIPAGQTVQQSNSLASPLQVFFGATPAKLSYSGLAPGAVGLYQFNVVVPDVANSDAVPISYSLNGVPGTQTLYTAVHN